MPFGLNIAPLIFTRIMRAAFKPIRRDSIRIVAYLDDILIISESKEREVEDTGRTVRWLQSLCFIINAKKSMSSLSWPRRNCMAPLKALSSIDRTMGK